MATVEPNRLAPRTSGSFPGAPGSRAAGVGRLARHSLVAAGYALAIGLLVVVGTYSYRTIVELLGHVRDSTDSHRLIVRLQTVLSDLQDIEAGQRRYLLTGG